MTDDLIPDLAPEDDEENWCAFQDCDELAVQSCYCNGFAMYCEDHWLMMHPEAVICKS